MRIYRVTVMRKDGLMQYKTVKAKTEKEAREKAKNEWPNYNILHSEEANKLFYRSE